MSESAYESLYDFAHDLHTKGLGFQFPIIHSLQPFVNTFQEKIDPKFNVNHPLAGNRTRNRTAIRTQNRTCRRPLRVGRKGREFVGQFCAKGYPSRVIEKYTKYSVKWYFFGPFWTCEVEKCLKIALSHHLGLL